MGSHATHLQYCCNQVQILWDSTEVNLSGICPIFDYLFWDNKFFHVLVVGVFWGLFFPSCSTQINRNLQILRLALSTVKFIFYVWVQAWLNQLNFTHWLTSFSSKKASISKFLWANFVIVKCSSSTQINIVPWQPADELIWIWCVWGRKHLKYGGWRPSGTGVLRPRVKMKLFSSSLTPWYHKMAPK